MVAVTVHHVVVFGEYTTTAVGGVRSNLLMNVSIPQLEVIVSPKIVLPVPLNLPTATISPY
jgi:hypothetical protein